MVRAVHASLISRNTRTVRPVILDPPTHRFLLRKTPDVRESCWSVPRVLLRPGENHRRGTVRYLRRELRLPCLRIAPVIGRLNSLPPGLPLEYLVLAGPAVGSWEQQAHQALGPTARWWTTAALRVEKATVEPAQLPDLIDGYWDCWLPDGEICLD